MHAYIKVSGDLFCYLFLVVNRMLKLSTKHLTHKLAVWSDITYSNTLPYVEGINQSCHKGIAGEKNNKVSGKV